MILDGDAIRKQVRQAEENYERAPVHERHASLALWLIAEQLYEIRQLISISLERKP